MMYKSITLLLSLSAVAACGGTTSGGAGATDDVTVLRTFSDGAGVARVSTTVSGETFTGNVIGPDIQVFELADDPAAVDLSGTTFAFSNAYGDFYTGTATVNGVLFNVIAYEDNGGELVGVYLENGLGSAATVLGPVVSNIPRDSFVYNGTNVFAFRDGTVIEDGTFSMNVNFVSGTASLTGSTEFTTIGGSGIDVNINDGTFSGTNLTVNDDGTPSFANIDGNFHGDGATGVTGIYTQNASNPYYAGVIVGTR